MTEAYMYSGMRSLSRRRLITANLFGNHAAVLAGPRWREEQGQMTPGTAHDLQELTTTQYIT